MTLSSAAALSILIPINIEQPDAPSSPESLSSVDIESDDENDREVASKRQSGCMPSGTGAIIRPQFSCPDFGMGTARMMMGRVMNVPPVPAIPIHLRTEKAGIAGTADAAEAVEGADAADGSENTSYRRVRKMNSFVQVSTPKRNWEESFGQETPLPRKRHGGIFLGRLQTYSPFQYLT
jgi:hypothetical protein